MQYKAIGMNLFPSRLCGLRDSSVLIVVQALSVLTDKPNDDGLQAFVELAMRRTGLGHYNHGHSYPPSRSYWRVLIRPPLHNQPAVTGLETVL